MRHRVQKLIFDLSVDKRLDAFAIQQTVSDRFWTDLMPEMEKLFEDPSSNDQIILIEKLEIDLGNISETIIETGDWISLFREVLQKTLDETINDLRAWDNDSIESLADNSLKQWLFFIRNGYLPWNAGIPSDEWLTQVLESIAGNYSNASILRKLIAHNANATKRIVLQHTPEFLSHLVETLTAEKQTTLPTSVLQLVRWMNDLEHGNKKHINYSKKEIIQKIWMAILQKAAMEITGQNTNSILKYILVEWLQLKPAELINLVRNASLQEHDPFTRFITKDLIKDIPVMDSENSSGYKMENIEEPEQLLQKIKKKLGEEIKSDEDLSEDITIAEEGIYIANAGVILLHPFLPSFFKKLGLIENGAFIDTMKQQRAICLIRELAESDNLIEEYQLVLAKFLCGWPVQKPVDTDIQFTVEEKDEIQFLLKAAIDQWEILKNTSPVALQETFLQREGKLFNRDEKWYLQIEKKPVDILLTRLPWTIGMIKLPWMKELLRVEWM